MAAAPLKDNSERLPGRRLAEPPVHLRPLCGAAQPLILISRCPLSCLQGHADNDGPSDVFMSTAEPSVSPQSCGKSG